MEGEIPRINQHELQQKIEINEVEEVGVEDEGFNALEIAEGRRAEEGSGR